MAKHKMVIFTYEFFHYHVARCRCARLLGTKMGWDVLLYAGQLINPAVPMPKYLEAFNTDPPRVIAQRVSSYDDPRIIKVALDWLDRDNPDAVAVLGYSTRMDRAVLGWCRSRRRGAILLSESQAIDFPRSVYREWIKKKWLSLFDAALVGGTPHRAYALQLGMPAERVFIGYDVVDNEYWGRVTQEAVREQDKWRRLYNLLAERFFLTVCRFVPKKNLPGLLRAYALYASLAGGSPWHLVIAGTGPMEEEIRSLIAQLGLGELVHLPGYLSAEQLGPLYALASTFILPSLYSEQWGLVVNEAMAARLPVLVSNICGCAPDLVIEEVTGFTFDPRDERRLAELMLRMHSGEVDLEKMGRAAQKHIANYSPDLFARNLLQAAEVAIEHAKRRRWFPWPPPQWWI